MKKFISHPAPQKCFKLFWYDQLLPKEEQIFNTWLKVLAYFNCLIYLNKHEF